MVIVILSSLMLIGFCIGADHTIFQWENHWNKLPRGKVLRAMTDSLVHGVIGGWCWMNVIILWGSWSLAKAVQVLLCVIMAAGIDLDHMIEAKSLSIKDALNLSNRPFAHNSTLIPIGALALYLILYLCPSMKQNSITQDLPLMFVISILSHHLRDASRRGVWIAPFGSTPAIPGKLYVFLIALLPLFVVAASVTVRRLQKLSTSHTTIKNDSFYA